MINFIKNNREVKELYINQDLLNRIIEDFKALILDNKETFKELYKLDKEKIENSININNMIKLLDLYKNEPIKKSKKEIIVASYYGNPLITINLCIQSILKNRGTIVIIEDTMLGINKLLIKMYNSILNNYKIISMVELYNNIRIQEIKQIENSYDFIVCIGNTNTYYNYCKNEIKNLKYISFYNVSLYCNDSKFEKLKYELYKFALKNTIEIEIYDDIEEFIECTNINEEIKNVLVFSQNTEEIKKCKNRIKNLKLFINQNPFKDEKFKIEIV